MGFCGRASPPCSSAATLGFKDQARQSPALIERNSCDRICILHTTGFNMRSLRTIITLASIAAIASSIFAVSWIGLALLGF